LTETRACPSGRAPTIGVSDRLGGDDGIELIRELRAGGLTVPLLLLTGHGDEEVAVRALKAGAADYLAKRRLTPQAVGRALRHALELANEAGLRRRAEDALRLKDAQLEEARRLEALATLASGLAHEFNNALNVITGHAELAERRLLEDAPARRHLKRVLEAAARLASSRRAGLQPQPGGGVLNLTPRGRLRAKRGRPGTASRSTAPRLRGVAREGRPAACSRS
jgi:CheY-like chemotaxis protein